MKKFPGAAAAAAIAGLTLLTAVLAARGVRTPAEYGDQKSSSQAGKRVPVIVELFTSEGCSSCPSADTVLAQLQRDQPVANTRIIALSEHVDYWNYIGWADPSPPPSSAIGSGVMAGRFGSTASIRRRWL